MIFHQPLAHKMQWPLTDNRSQKEGGVWKCAISLWKFYLKPSRKVMLECVHVYIYSDTHMHTYTHTQQEYKNLNWIPSKLVTVIISREQGKDTWTQ